MKTCFLCGYQAKNGFVRRWANMTLPVWVCRKIVECEQRRGR